MHSLAVWQSLYILHLYVSSELLPPSGSSNHSYTDLLEPVWIRQEVSAVGHTERDSCSGKFVLPVQAVQDICGFCSRSAVWLAEHLSFLSLLNPPRNAHAPYI